MTTTGAMYTVYQAPGWHGEPTDPIILQTDDEHEAAMLAGERVDLGIPGESNRYDAYALDEDGDPVDRIESFRCDQCEQLVEWGEDGPVGTRHGHILSCPQAMESHLVTWVCDGCAANMDDD